MAARERGEEAEALWSGLERMEVWMEKAEEIIGSGESPEQVAEPGGIDAANQRRIPHLEAGDGE